LTFMPIDQWTFQPAKLVDHGHEGQVTRWSRPVVAGPLRSDRNRTLKMDLP